MLLEKDFAMQGGVRNYLGKTKEVKAPKYWKSSPESPSTELAYITEAEKGLLVDANLHGSLKDGKANIGASGLLSYDGFGSTDSSQNRAGGDVSGAMDRGQDDSGQQSSGGGSTDAFQGQQSNQYNTAMSESQQQRVVAQNVVDLVDQGVNINDALTGKTTLERLTGSPFFSINALKEVLSPFANSANKRRRNNYMTTAMIKEYELGTGLNWNPNGVLVKNSPEYNYLFNETDYKNTLGDNNVSTNDNDNVVFDNPEDVKIIENTSANRVDSVAAKFFGQTANNFKFSFENEYAAAKAKQKALLGTSSAIGQLAVNQSPFYNWLKDKSLNKGIL
tara:strand:+ start:754 stop:1755 length:1002 start_codon:yes stop_codon:yes gene_type:complete